MSNLGINKKLLYKSFLETIDKNENKRKKENNNNNEINDKKHMDNLIKNMNMQFNNYNSFTFLGWDKNKEFTSNEINNPDLFDDLIYFKKINSKKKQLLKICNIDVEIENLEGLIKLINDYPYDEKVKYNINMCALHKIKDPLIELNSMIGMNTIKENIVDQILYYIQDLHKVNNISSGDYMHTVIYGPPGSGKTEIAKILGKIFSKLGILKKGTFKKVTRSDLVAGYLGQTAIKTREAINECLGGCLFIDEAYALGNSDKRDSFSKECIDTLCEALSDHKDELMVIIAGYEKELNECFFAYNQGLESRFTWRFKTDDYKAEELNKIFLKKITDCNWSIDETDNKISDEKNMKTWFEKNMIYFKYYGRDIEALLSKIKIAHSRRVFCKKQEEKTKITFKDLEKGLKIYLNNEEVKNRKDIAYRKDYLQSTMYV